jgi:hypothetical protein
MIFEYHKVSLAELYNEIHNFTWYLPINSLNAWWGDVGNNRKPDQPSEENNDNFVSGKIHLRDWAGGNIGIVYALSY